MDKKIIKYFKENDSVIFKLYEKYGDVEPHRAENLFTDLCETIVGQQLSVKAAKTIYKRFEELFKGEITPEKILKMDKEKIRACGMSYSKVAFVKDLSDRILKGELVLEEVEKLSDEEVIKELVKVKGIGPWTAEMFLMFSLGRENVFSYGDLGLKNAIAKNYKLDSRIRGNDVGNVIPERTHVSIRNPDLVQTGSRVKPGMTKQRLLRRLKPPRNDGGKILKQPMKQVQGMVQDGNKLKEIIKKWEPYKTYACLLLWKSLNNLPS